MPEKIIQVEAERFLVHNGVTVFHTYVNGDVDQGRNTNYFTTMRYEIEGEEEFDVRDLKVPSRHLLDEHPPCLSRSCNPQWDTASEQQKAEWAAQWDAWHNGGEERAIRTIITEAIDLGLIRAGEDVDDDDETECPMMVSLDGGLTFSPAPEGVRIVYRGVMIDGEDGRGELHINATHEGLITDLWTTRDEPLDHNIGTESMLIEDLVTRLVNDGLDPMQEAIKVLIDRLGGDSWASCAEYSRETWQHEVECNDTSLGYWEWVIHQAEADEVDLSELTASTSDDGADGAMISSDGGQTYEPIEDFLARVPPTAQ